MKKEDGGYFTSIREYRKYLEEEGTIQKDEKSEMKEAVKAELAREREEANAEKARTMLDTAFNDLPESQRAEALTLLNQLRPSNPTPEQAETLISTIRRSIRRPERSTTPSPRSSFMQNSYESRDETDDYEDTVKLYAKVLNVEYT